MRPRCWRWSPTRCAGGCWPTLTDASHCVCELQPVGGVAPTLFSYHLRVLHEAGPVTATRRDGWIDYALADGPLDRLDAALPAPVGPSCGCG